MVTYGHCPYHTSSGDCSADFGQFNFLIVATLKEKLVTKAMPPHITTATDRNSQELFAKLVAKVNSCVGNQPTNHHGFVNMMENLISLPKTIVSFPSGFIPCNKNRHHSIPANHQSRVLQSFWQTQKRILHIILIISFFLLLDHYCDYYTYLAKNCHFGLG